MWGIEYDALLVKNGGSMFLVHFVGNVLRDSLLVFMSLFIVIFVRNGLSFVNVHITVLQ